MVAVAPVPGIELAFDKVRLVSLISLHTKRPLDYDGSCSGGAGAASNSGTCHRLSGECLDASPATTCATTCSIMQAARIALSRNPGIYGLQCVRMGLGHFRQPGISGHQCVRIRFKKCSAPPQTIMDPLVVGRRFNLYLSTFMTAWTEKTTAPKGLLGSPNV